MSDDHTGLSITLPARSENVAVVRHAVAGLAEELGMREPAVGDLKTVVTEACMNVVVHAYEGEPGPLEVEAIPNDSELTVIVRDFGSGIRPQPEDERPSLRIGLTLIAALSSSFEISGGLNQGTRITMRMPLSTNGSEKRSQAALPAPEETELKIGDRALIGPVLGRVVGALAARHQIAIDRLNDAYLITDALAAEAPGAFRDGHACFSVANGKSGIHLKVGPVPSGAGQELREGLGVPEIGGSLESLADEMRVEEDESGEYLVISFSVHGEQS